MQNDPWAVILPLLIGLVGTLIGSLPMLIANLSGRGKVKAEGDSVVVRDAIALLPAQGQVIASMQQQWTAQNVLLDDMTRKYENERQYVHILTDFCIDNKLPLPPRPDGNTED